MYIFNIILRKIKRKIYDYFLKKLIKKHDKYCFF